MPTSPGPKPNAVDLHSQQHGAIFERLFQGQGLLVSGAGIAITWDGSRYIISSSAPRGGGGGGASVQQFKIVSDSGDYWTCKTWDGTTIGSTEIKVAKPFKLRCSTGAITSETVRGQLQNYSYALTGNYYVRTVTDSGGTIIERDVIIPDAIANDIIYGISFSTASPATLADVTWLDINADGRAWAEV